jgi:hypothetical protein
MNLYSESTQVGFLVAMYFMASAIVALTLVYFSRPKPKKRESHNKVEPLEQVKSAEGQAPDQPEKDARNESIEAAKPETVQGSPEPLAVVNPAKAAAASPPGPPAEKEELDLKKPKNVDQPAVEKQASPEQGGDLKKEENPHQKSPLITVTNAPKSQPESAAAAASVQEKPAAGSARPVESNEIKPETGVPPAQIGNTVKENAAKNENEAKPKTTKADSDFSELFAEDTEETEASRLAKELEDIDTEDILKTSQDLISQIKVNKH